VTKGEPLTRCGFCCVVLINRSKDLCHSTWSVFSRSYLGYLQIGALVCSPSGAFFLRLLLWLKINKKKKIYCSTFDTDVIMVKRDQFADALEAWATGGITVEKAIR
jgi:hypothetical protein